MHHGQSEVMHAETNPAYAVTRAQLSAVAILTLLALAAGVLWSVSFANLTLSAKQVGGLVMPPGMIMTRETSAEAMRDMSAVDSRHVRYRPATDARGDQPVEPRIENGVKVFELEAAVATACGSTSRTICPSRRRFTGMGWFCPTPWTVRQR